MLAMYPATPSVEPHGAVYIGALGSAKRNPLDTTENKRDTDRPHGPNRREQARSEDSSVRPLDGGHMIQPPRTAYGSPPAAPEQTKGVTGQWSPAALPPPATESSDCRVAEAGAMVPKAPSRRGGNDPGPAPGRAPHALDSDSRDCALGGRYIRLCPTKTPPNAQFKTQPVPKPLLSITIRPLVTAYP